MTDSPADKLNDIISYPMLNPAFVAVQVDENSLHLRTGPWSGPIYTISDKDEENSITRLPELLDGETHVDRILEEFEKNQQQEIAEFLVNMVANNVILEANDVQAQSGFPRIALQQHFSTENEKRFQSVELSIINSGGVGHQIARDLLSMGIGGVRFLNIADNPIEDSNLKDYDRFTESNSANMTEYINNAEFLVYTAEAVSPANIEKINQITHDTGTPWSIIRTAGFDGVIGPTIFPGETACYSCFHERMRANVPDIEGFDAYHKHRDDQVDQSTIRHHPLARLVAGYATLDLINLLAYGQGFTVGRVITFNSLDLSVEANDVLKLPRCDTCGKTRGDDVRRFIDHPAMKQAREHLADTGKDNQ